MQRLIRDVYESNGVVAACCNGPSGLLNAKNHDGTSFIKGKRVTAYSDLEKDDWWRVSGMDGNGVERGQSGKIRKSGQTLVEMPFSCESEFRRVGAVFVGGTVGESNVVIDGRLVTGQNPASAIGVAREVLIQLVNEG